MAAENITVIVRIKAKPDSKERVRRELQELLAPTRQEQGCLNYDMHVAKDDDALFLFHENWDSEGDLNRHLATPHVQRWIALAESLLAEPMELTLWRKVD
jgi:quinol monooxygenase YgiN